MSESTRIEKIFHPSTGRMEEFVCRNFDFAIAGRMPVLIVYVTCDYSFEVFGGRIIEKGPCVLLLRRGFSVGAMPGLWSVVAGVDDIIDPRLMPFLGKEIRVVDEISDETGISYGNIINLSHIGERDQPNSSKPDQIFEQFHYWAKVNPVKTVSLNYEHTGAIWVPIQVIGKYLETGATEDKELQTILRDGVVPGFFEGMSFLWEKFRQK